MKNINDNFEEWEFEFEGQLIDKKALLKAICIAALVVLGALCAFVGICYLIF